MQTYFSDAHFNFGKFTKMQLMQSRTKYLVTLIVSLIGHLMAKILLFTLKNHLFNKENTSSFILFACWRTSAYKSIFFTHIYTLITFIHVNMCMNVLRILKCFPAQGETHTHTHMHCNISSNSSAFWMCVRMCMCMRVRPKTPYIQLSRFMVIIRQESC